MTFDPEIVAHAKVAVAAALGGVVRMFLRPAKSLRQSALLILSCVTCGFYSTWPIMDWLNLPVDYVGAVGALAGLAGLSVAEGLLRAVDGFDFKALLSAVLTKGGRP